MPPSTVVDQDPCGTSTALGWPAGIAGGASANTIDILDITSFLIPTFYLFTTVGTNPGDARWNLVQGVRPNEIKIVDLTNIITLAPPMLSGNAALFNSCPWPP